MGVVKTCDLQCGWKCSSSSSSWTVRSDASSPAEIKSETQTQSGQRSIWRKMMVVRRGAVITGVTTKLSNFLLKRPIWTRTTRKHGGEWTWAHSVWNNPHGTLIISQDVESLSLLWSTVFWLQNNHQVWSDEGPVMHVNSKLFMECVYTESPSSPRHRDTLTLVLLRGMKRDASSARGTFYVFVIWEVVTLLWIMDEINIVEYFWELKSKHAGVKWTSVERNISDEK